MNQSTTLSPQGHPAQRPGQLASPKPGVGVSPLRFLFSLIARLRTVDGPSLETDLAEEALQEEAQGLATCAGAATKVETSLDRYCVLLKEAAADSILTPAEYDSLCRTLLTVKRRAHNTTRYIGALR